MLIMSNSLEKFLQGVAASVHLFNKAVEKRVAFECIVLQSNMIDGILRIGLILKEQLDKRNSKYNELLLKQDDSDSIIPERAIYRKALDNKVIDKNLFNNLSEAYDKRNKCIHRYILCSIDYDFVTNLVFELDNLISCINDRVHYLEKSQIEQGIGMTVDGPLVTSDYLNEFAAQKEKPYNL